IAKKDITQGRTVDLPARLNVAGHRVSHAALPDRALYIRYLTYPAITSATGTKRSLSQTFSLTRTTAISAEMRLSAVRPT
ncbi:hypothetical protein, partial [Pantoea ananatis]|uniref:hypothetical protein n=1 Tax=Pantoea ananas TaxID=553 RepID=UPI0023B10999